MGVTELVATVLGSGSALYVVINALMTRGKTKRELQSADITMSGQWDQIIGGRLATMNQQLKAVADEAELCRRRCDRYSELTLDLIDMLATHGITEIDEYRRRYRDIREMGRTA